MKDNDQKLLWETYQQLNEELLYNDVLQAVLKLFSALQSNQITAEEHVERLKQVLEATNSDQWFKAQKILREWKITSAKRHIDFEKAMKAKKQQLLDLGEFVDEGYITKQKSGDISAQLKKLHDLYKDGIITGYEYEKAKKKILD